MSSKILSLTIAGVIGLQSSAYAQQDRTAGIGDNHIRVAQENVRTLRTELLTLDKALADAKETILLRDSRGSVLNGAAVTGAALGLGLSAIAGWTLRNPARGDSAFASLMMGGILAAFAAVSSAGSAGLGVIGQGIKPKIDAEELNDQLMIAESKLNSAITAGSDKETNEMLAKLKESLASLRTAVAEYESDESVTANTRFASHAAQAVGSALLIYGMMQDKRAATVVGPLVMTAGNLGRMISLLTSADIQLILNEIEGARRSLAAASVALK